MTAKELYFSQLAKKMRYYKEEEKGVEIMCRIMEDMRNDLRIDIALEMIKGGKLSLEDIAQYSGLSIEKVRELAEDKSA